MRVTNFGWSVSSTTGTDIKGAILNVTKERGFKVVRGYQTFLVQNGELNGKRFDSSEEAHAAAEAHGYTVRATRRPTSFIHLRLSPATRRFLKPLSQAERLLYLFRICKGSPCNMIDYLDKSFMTPRLAEWMEYLDGKNPESKDYAKHA